MKPINPIDIRRRFGTSGLEVVQFIQSSLEIHNQRHGTQVRILSHDNAEDFVIIPSLGISLSSAREILEKCPQKAWYPFVSKDTTHSGSVTISLSSSASSSHSTPATRSSNDLKLKTSATSRAIKAAQQKEDFLCNKKWNKNLFPSYKNYFLIIGPGPPAYGAQAGVALTEAFQKIAGEDGMLDVVGDGQNRISLREISEKLLQFVRRAQSPICIVVRGHGKEEQGNFLLKFSHSTWVYNSELLGIIEEAVGKVPVSIFYTTCHSHAAHRDTSSLPPGSSIVTLSEDAAINDDVERWIGSLSSLNVNAASILQLLLVYLTEGVLNHYSPKLEVVGVGIIQIEDILHQYVASAVPRSAIRYVRDLTIDRKATKAIAAKISASSTAWDIDAVDYGRALALVLWSFISRS